MNKYIVNAIMVNPNDFAGCFCVYLLHVKDNKYKYGITERIKMRLYEHTKGITYTNIINIYKCASKSVMLKTEKEFKGYAQYKKIARSIGTYTEIIETEDINKINNKIANLVNINNAIFLNNNSVDICKICKIKCDIHLIVNINNLPPELKTDEIINKLATTNQVDIHKLTVTWIENNLPDDELTLSYFSKYRYYMNNREFKELDINNFTELVKTKGFNIELCDDDINTWKNILNKV